MRQFLIISIKSQKGIFYVQSREKKYGYIAVKVHKA